METYMDIMKRKTVKELRSLCKANIIKGYSNWAKQKLIDELNRVLNMHELSSEENNDLNNKTVKELKQLCKTKGIKGYSKCNKQNLVEILSDQDNQNYKTKAKLIELCETRGIRVNSKWNKQKIIDKLSRTDAFIQGTQTLINPQPGSSQDELPQDHLSQDQLSQDQLPQINPQPSTSKYHAQIINDEQTSTNDMYPIVDAEEIKIVRSNGAWNDMVVDYTIYYDKGQYDLINYLDDITPSIINIYQKALERKSSIKVKLVACVQYNEFNIYNEIIGKNKCYFHSNHHNILIPNAIEPALTQMKVELLDKFDSYNTKNTKYKFDRVILVDIQSDKYNPLRGGTWVKLPNFIIGKKCCINVKNVKTNKFKCLKQEDLRCFEYALESMLNPAKDHPEYPSKYNISKYESLNMNYPVDIIKDNIEKYEEFLNISINVYTIKQDVIELIYVSEKLHENRTHVNLLEYQEHIVGIKSISSLLTGQIHKYDHKMYICQKCQKAIEDINIFNEHIQSCIHNKTNVSMPKNLERKYISNGAEQFHPYTIELDFECTLKKLIDNQHLHEHIANSFAFNTPYENNIINNENAINLLDSFNELLIKYGKDYNKIRKINISMEWSEEAVNKYNEAKKCEICNIEFNSNADKRADHDHATGEFRTVLCNKCNLNLNLPKFIPIIIHNLKYDSKLFLQWILKLSNYVNTEQKYSDIKIIPNTTENYITFSKTVVIDQYKLSNDWSKCTKCKKEYKNKIVKKCEVCSNESQTKSKMIIKRKGDLKDETIEFRFIDSYRFISTSLDQAVKNLAEVNNSYCGKCNSKQEICNIKYQPIENKILKIQANCKKCNNLVKKPVDYSKFKNILKHFKEEDLHFVLQKGIYPYEWVDSYDKMYEQLPQDKNDWYSTLNDAKINDTDFNFANRFYKHFKCENFKEYHNLYLKLDTLLLADVFYNFRKTCYDNYGIDPVYYISAPNLSDNASLKYTKQVLELIKDQSLYELYENGIRGGQSVIPHRYAIANNCYFYDQTCGKTVKLSKEKAIEKGIYNSEKHLSYIMYLDANNLYGYALSQPLPIGDFKEDQVGDFNKENILNLEYAGERGYTFVVDLKIPNELHDKFKDYPMLPEHYTPCYDELSDYQKKLISTNVGSIPKNSKLISTLKSKENYIIDYRMLQECLKQGVILMKINKVISFKQKAWLKPYIDKNTKLRQEAKNDFEKDFYKLMNNSVYGKQMENLRKRCDVKLINTYEQFQKHKDYENRVIISDENALLFRKKKKITLNKPIYGGFVVLELSKLCMYKFYYNVLKLKYNDKIKLLGTDTDSFIIYIETDDFYEDMMKDIHHYDTCNYNIEWMPQANNKVPGLFKDEYLGIPLREFVGLRAKMYAFIHDIDDYNKCEKKVCKGIKKRNVEKMRFNMYKDSLINSTTTTEIVYNIISSKLKLYTTKTNKIALSPYDDKRYLVDEINTLPYGYINYKY